VTQPAAKGATARIHRRAVAARLAALFDQHASMVLGLCRLLLRDHHEAEDAAQQTFVSAYRSMLRGSEPRDAAPWLAAIARNECRARIRQRMRSPMAIEGEVEELLADRSDDLADEADRRAELAALTAAIAELPARQREAVALRDFLGLSYEEVASTLSVSVPVVESLLFRARRRLRDSVRTVPRYAAGLVALPLALRGVFSRDGHDLDSLGAAGLAGAAGAAIAGVVAKAVSLPFATKAATAVTVVVAAAVGPQLPGVIDPGTTEPQTTASVSISTTPDPSTAAVASDLVSTSKKPSSKPAPQAPAGEPSTSTVLVEDSGGSGGSSGPADSDSGSGSRGSRDEGQQDDGGAADPERNLVETAAGPTQAPPETTAPATDDGASDEPAETTAPPEDVPVIGADTAPAETAPPAAEEPAVTIGPEGPITDAPPPAEPPATDATLPVIGG
jgi:RNA polymerase sigma-70 factor (ECF subfamily)